MVIMLVMVMMMVLKMVMVVMMVVMVDSWERSYYPYVGGPW